MYVSLCKFKPKQTKITFHILYIKNYFVALLKTVVKEYFKPRLIFWRCLWCLETPDLSLLLSVKNLPSMTNMILVYNCYATHSRHTWINGITIFYLIVIKASKIFGKSLFAIAKLESYGDQVKSFSGYILVVVVVFVNQFIARTELELELELEILQSWSWHSLQLSAQF